jgi:hypothetical protein
LTLESFISHLIPPNYALLLDLGRSGLWELRRDLRYEERQELNPRVLIFVKFLDSRILEKDFCLCFLPRRRT